MSLTLEPRPVAPLDTVVARSSSAQIGRPGITPLQMRTLEVEAFVPTAGGREGGFFHLHPLGPSRLGFALGHPAGGGAYATAFLADYDDDSGRLRYMSLGHVPPVLLRRTGETERLEARPTRRFSRRPGSICEAALHPGDLLLLFTEGLTRARTHRGTEFGVQGLVQAAKALRHLPARKLLESLVRTHDAFTHAGQGCDWTLVVMRVIAAPELTA